MCVWGGGGGEESIVVHYQVTSEMKRNANKVNSSNATGMEFHDKKQEPIAFIMLTKFH